MYIYTRHTDRYTHIYMYNIYIYIICIYAYTLATPPHPTNNEI